jgi:type II secretory pathway pseudopilin PulG
MTKTRTNKTQVQDETQIIKILKAKLKAEQQQNKTLNVALSVAQQQTQYKIRVKQKDFSEYFLTELTKQEVNKEVTQRTEQERIYIFNNLQAQYKMFENYCEDYLIKVQKTLNKDMFTTTEFKEQLKTDLNLFAQIK